MAIDTKEKRMNAGGAVLAQGTIDEQMRIAIGHGYGGNALTPSSVDPTGGETITPRAPIRALVGIAPIRAYVPRAPIRNL